MRHFLSLDVFYCFRWNNDTWIIWVVGTLLYFTILNIVCNKFTFRCNNSEMYEMFCVVISGLTFVWVLSARSWYSVAFIEASLEELPERAELGPSCLATKISALGHSLHQSSPTAYQRWQPLFWKQQIKTRLQNYQSFWKSLGSPRTSLEHKALGDLMGTIRWLILYG